MACNCFLLTTPQSTALLFKRVNITVLMMQNDYGKYVSEIIIDCLLLSKGLILNTARVCSAISSWFLRGVLLLVATSTGTIS